MSRSLQNQTTTRVSIDPAPESTSTKSEGETPFERFEELTKNLISLPKSEVEKKAKEQGLGKNDYPQ